MGQKMFEWAIKRAKEKGAHVLQLTTDKQRPDALRFYESLGFKASHEGMKLHFQLDMKTEFRIISYASDAWREAISLRERILRTAVGLSFDPSELEQERDHIHVGGYAFEKMLASCVLVPEEKAMKMQRVVVDEAFEVVELEKK